MYGSTWYGSTWTFEYGVGIGIGFIAVIEQMPMEVGT
jgi:hypothetical protein